MRKLYLCLFLFLPLAIWAQGEWEVPDATPSTQVKTKAKKEKKAQQAEDYKWAKYLGDIIPIVDGNVEWQRTFQNHRSAEENYTMMLDFLTKMTKEEGQLPPSKVQLVNKTEHKIVCHFEEWMVFVSTVLVLDRGRFIYTIACDCYDNRVEVKLMRLSYLYDETHNGGTKYKAEEWITDKYAVNKKRTRLLKITGKYRRKTVDRMEEILENMNRLLTSE